jgi:hypothetical protein
MYLQKVISKDDVNVPSKSNKQRNLYLFFVGILSATDEKSRICIRRRIRIRESVVRIRGPGFVPKCHGSITLISDPQKGVIKTRQDKKHKTKKTR